MRMGAKLISIAEYQRWTEADKMLALSLVLEGTALENYDLLKTRNADLPFSTLVQRMLERFGQQAMYQRVNETPEHWGDRVMTMAQQAFGRSTTLEVLHEQMV
jgi:hypothetical protein